ncbi:glycosyltransferase [Geomonas sp. RF6]|uniref:glycosyltransferase family 2 protein n=1 Tax=Geomonas sp. RF6 TaxID=2897342 RepID=UPI001E5B12B1|nr:glycosyltransferase [Geomonas sp. RF6]UFS72846.1 glycosyltransferase [Geomonas sp. RF6]
MIHILLPVHNRRELTRRFVACLKAQSYRNFRLVLVDDGSGDGTAAMVREEIPEVTVITGSGSWWWAGCLQQGCRFLERQGVPDSDVVLFANDDTAFDPDFLERAVAFLAARPRTLLLAHAFDAATGVLCDRGVRIDWPRLRIEKVFSDDDIGCFSTRGLFMRMGDVRETGGFFPRLLPHYLSDYEFTLRARRRGVRLATTPEVRLFLNVETTGHHALGADSLRECLVKFCSMKSADNLLCWTSFIVLACPSRWMLRNIVWLWGTALRKVGRAMSHSFFWKTPGTNL